MTPAPRSAHVAGQDVKRPKSEARQGPRCKQQVFTRYDRRPRQCGRFALKGEWCYQHHPDNVDRRHRFEDRTDRLGGTLRKDLISLGLSTLQWESGELTDAELRALCERSKRTMGG